MIPTMMKTAVRPLLAWLGALCVLGLWQGCSREEPAPAPPPATVAPSGAEDLSVALPRLISKIEAATDVTTVEVGNPSERVASRMARRAPVYTARPLNLRSGFPKPPQGLLVGQLTLVPKVLAIANTGVIVTGGEDGARAWPVAAGAQAQPIDADPVIQAQVDGSGERLLLQTVSHLSIRSGPLFEIAQQLDGNIPPGRAHWLTDDTLLFAQERILDFNASAPQRVYTSSMLWNIGTGRWNRPWFDPLAYAKLGTFPVQEAAWGTPLLPHQLESMPGPVLRIEDDGTTVSLTREVDCADLSVAMDQMGDVLAVRTWRHGGGQSRAILQWADSITTPTLQLTSVATHRVALSPSGDWMAAVIGEPGFPPELRRYRREDVAGDWVAVHELYRQEQSLRAKALAVSNSLAAELGRRTGGIQPTAGPTRELCVAMGEQLKGALLEHFALQLPENELHALGAVDGLLDEVGDYFKEEPALIIALAGLVADALPQAHWEIAKEDEGLSPDVSDVIFGDSLSFTALQPFALARDRIAGDGRLSATVGEVKAGVLPIYLLENRRPETLIRLQSAQMKHADVDTQRVRLYELEDRLGNGLGDTRAVNLLVYTVATQRKDHALARRALWPLVETNPASAQGVAMLARNLYDDFQPDAAESLFRLAVEMSPGDPALRFSWADALMATQQFDRAREEFERSGRLDTAGALAPYLPSRLELLEKLRRESGQ
ncbi:hypothetical protein GC173_04000 [bacterium]|nr:hypothetical protein [bacterium]